MANTARNLPGKSPKEQEIANPLMDIAGKYEANKKRVNTMLTAVLVAVVGVFAYIKFVKEPKETKASNAISFAQTYFATDSLSKALNGDGQHKGFLQIIKSYSGSDAANLSEYYAGICYLRMPQGRDAKKAIEHLEAFDAKGTKLGATANGLLGDAYMETGNTKKGIEHYTKASSDKDDNVNTPTYLLRAGLAYEMDNQPEKAKEAYKRIRDEFPQSAQARDMDKYLARLGELN